MAWPALLGYAITAASAARQGTKQAQQERLSNIRIGQNQDNAFSTESPDNSYETAEAGVDLAMRIFGMTQ